MPRTFDIRFARATGFAAFLEAPANSFRWRGGASMSIDSAGVEIEPKRGWLSLLGRRTRIRINTADLREVSRAGAALRIEFGMPGTRRAVVPFWVRDSETAAEIVRLVPTRRTIETDEPAPESPRSRRGTWGWMGALVVIAVLGAAVPIWRATHDSASRLEARRPEIDSAIPVPLRAPMDIELPIDVKPAANGAGPLTAMIAPTVVDATGDIEPAVSYTREGGSSEASTKLTTTESPSATGVVAIGPSDPVYEAALRQLEGFQEYAANFYSRYLQGTAQPAELAASWAQYSQQLTGSADYRDPALRRMIDAELGASASWVRALTALAEATRRQDQAEIARARVALESASEQTAQIALHVERR